MRKVIVAGITFILLLGGYIVYMKIDERKFIDSLAPPSPIVNRPVNVLETTREVTQASEETKFQEVDTDELLAAVNRIPEQFGYSEASTTYAKLETKRMNGERLTIDENVTLLEAMLYLYPSEATRKSLIFEKWRQSKGPSYDKSNYLSAENIAELKELGIPVVHRGNVRIINPPPDIILKELAEEGTEEYRYIWRDFFAHGKSSAPAPDTVSLEGIGEDTVSPPDRSEIFPVTSESDVLDTSEPVHYEDGHVHEPPTLQPPAPTAAKGVEANGWEGLSPKQRKEAKEFFDRYGTEAGLRRFKEMAPEAAERFEREQRKPPVPSEPNDEPPTR